VSVGAIAWEAIRRINIPTDVAGNTVVWVSAVGILINTATALMFMSGRKGDLNVRGAFLHMAADAAISAGVVVAGFAILATGYHWIDPVVSLAISVVIIWGTWDLLRESVNMAMHGVPESVDLSAVKKYLAGLDGVTAVHDLHIWAMSTTETALTVHLVKPQAEIDDKLIADVCDKLHRDFGIGHSTIQLERGSSAHPCKQASDHTV
jgi:cobalt-zinc-cadmium efflux system protein